MALHHGALCFVYGRQWLLWPPRCTCREAFDAAVTQLQRKLKPWCVGSAYSSAGGLQAFLTANITLYLQAQEPHPQGGHAAHAKPPRQHRRRPPLMTACYTRAKGLPSGRPARAGAVQLAHVAHPCAGPCTLGGHPGAGCVCVRMCRLARVHACEHVMQGARAGLGCSLPRAMHK